MIATKRAKANRRELGALFGQQAVFFAAAFALSVAYAHKAPVQPIAPPPSTGGMLWYFLTAFAAATFLIILLLRSTKGHRVFSVMFALAIFTGIGSLMVRMFGTDIGILVTSLAVLTYYFVKQVFVFDLVLTLGMGGVAGYLGESLNPSAVLIILAILGIYDVLAVYGTKHMVKMSNALLQRKVFFAIILPVRMRGYLVKLDDVVAEKGFVFLGTGDVVLPGLLVAVTAARYGPWHAALPAIGAILGLGITNLLFIWRSGKQPMPALPPIALGAIIGFLFVTIIP